MMLAFDIAREALRGGTSVEAAAQSILQELTVKERLFLLDGDEPFYQCIHSMITNGYNTTPLIHGRIDRLGIPGVAFSDGPRGVVMGNSTAFPVPMARGATWNVLLEEEIGLAIGLEARAQGANFFGGVCINLPRHPSWGRVQETYGEDPILLGEFGAALTRGVQRNVIACVKHFALNSMENARFKIDVQVDDAALHEVYLPHFKRVVDEGAMAVMSSYNSVNGEWAGQNHVLLNEILRGQWLFGGIVVSDFFFGLRDAALSVRNGLDIECPARQQRAVSLQKALFEGLLTQEDVDVAATRILGVLLRFYESRVLTEPSKEVVFSRAHRDLALLAAQQSIVLLQNSVVGGGKLLPLEKDGISSCAVIGRLANTENTGDNGSSKVRCPATVTPYQGIKSAFSSKTLITLADSDEISEAVKEARASQVAIVIAGYDAADEGEYLVPSFVDQPELLGLFPPLDDSPSAQAMKARLRPLVNDVPQAIEEKGGDRKSLRLRAKDVEIIKAVTAVNPRTVVCIVTAGAVIMEEWRSQVPAVLQAWYSGSEGGSALADVLLGNVDATGRLPYSIPRQEDHLPSCDLNATSITYDRWFGQRLLDRLHVSAAFPLGFGLSYTSFEIQSMSIYASEKAPSLRIVVSVANTGSRDGRHVVQIYGSPKGIGSEFPSRLLLGFAPLSIGKGETRSVSVEASLKPLQCWENGSFKLVSSMVQIEASSFAGDAKAVTAEYHFENNFKL